MLVGHSYGGSVISNVDPGAGAIAGLVFVAGFAPDSGESAIRLTSRFPGSTLGDVLRPVTRSDGTTDLFIAQEHFHAQFAADVPAPEAAIGWPRRNARSRSRRSPSRRARVRLEGAAVVVPVRRRGPQHPAAAQHFMAKRAGAHRTIEIPGASHAIPVSQPEATAPSSSMRRGCSGATRRSAWPPSDDQRSGRGRHG